MVDSSWIDMLAGLSAWGIFKMPPCFWANAGAAADIAISKPPTTASAQRLRFICRFLELLVEPDVFEAPAVEQAVDHDRQAFDTRQPAACRAGVKDDRADHSSASIRSICQT